jgi:pilus assembly protein Flp/PilA
MLGVPDPGPQSGGHMKLIRRLHHAFQRGFTTDGQGLAEYALILALIAIVAIIALIFLGGQISTIISDVGNSM